MPTPNVFKSATTVSVGSIKRNNFLIGVEDSYRFGPTDNGVVVPNVDVTSTRTFFWNGITPTSNGYVVYTQKNSQGPSIRVANTDSDLILIASQFGGSNINTIYDALNFFNSDSQYLVTNIDYPNIVTSGLTLQLDAGFVPSYIRSGSTWNDVSGNGYVNTMVNAPTFSSQNNGSLVFNGTSQYTYVNSSGFFLTTGNNLFADVGYAFTVCAWFNFPVSHGVRAGNQSFAIVGQSGGIGGSETFTMYCAGDNTYGNFNNCLVVGIRGSKTQISTSTVNSGTWNYGCVTWNGTAGFTYFNGGNQTSLSVGTAAIQTGYFLGVGVTGYNGTLNNVPQYFEGNIGVVQIYNRSLSSSEILQNYNALKSRYGF